MHDQIKVLEEALKNATSTDLKGNTILPDTDFEIIERAARRDLAAMKATTQDTPSGNYLIEHYGFKGDVIGSYVTREGKRGVVIQQDGTRVVHVYGEKWLKPDSLSQPPSNPAQGQIPDWLRVVWRMFLEHAVTLNFTDNAKPHHMAVWYDVSKSVKEDAEKWQSKGQPDIFTSTPAASGPELDELVRARDEIDNGFKIAADCKGNEAYLKLSEYVLRTRTLLTAAIEKKGGV